MVTAPRRASADHDAVRGRPRLPRCAVALALLGSFAVAAATAVAVWTHLGQRADQRSGWSVAVPDAVQRVILDWLHTVSVSFVAVAVVAIVLVALARSRAYLAAGALVLVAGANVTTQLLKLLIPRPDYGVGYDANSLPSGHTTVMVSLGLAAILVAPRALRPPLVAVAALLGTLTGAATVLERWHRPSDVVAALGVCAVWAALSVVLAGAIRRAPRRAPRTARRLPGPRLFAHAVAGLLGAAAVGAVLLTGGLVSRGTPGDLLLGAFVLTVMGLGSVLVAALTAGAMDELDEVDDRGVPPQRPVRAP